MTTFPWCNDCEVAHAPGLCDLVETYRNIERLPDTIQMRLDDDWTVKALCVECHEATPLGWLDDHGRCHDCALPHAACTGCGARKLLGDLDEHGRCDACTLPAIEWHSCAFLRRRPDIDWQAWRPCDLPVVGVRVVTLSKGGDRLDVLVPSCLAHQHNGPVDTVPTMHHDAMHACAELLRSWPVLIGTCGHRLARKEVLRPGTEHWCDTCARWVEVVPHPAVTS